MKSWGSILTQVARRCVPTPVRNRLWTLRRRFSAWPPVGLVRFGDLRRTRPISSIFGLDRGRCIDRLFIEDFLRSNASDIRGRVLEVAEDTYSRRFGGAAVERCDVLHADHGNPVATIVGDLATGDGIPESAFDCVIVTQTLHCIFDMAGAVKTIQRALKPGGVALATLPGISQISRYDMDRWGDYWRFTSLSARRLFEATFPPDRVSVKAHGNVLVAAAFLYGLAVEDLRLGELEADDPDYEVLITVRAEKGQAAP